MPKAPTVVSSKKRQGYTKAYRLTCSNCRTRKVKCDGDQPHCRICQAYGDSCHYDKPPPMSQVLAMAEKIEQLESKLAALQQSDCEPRITAPPSQKPELATTTIDSMISPKRAVFDIASAVEQHESPSYQSTSAVQELFSSNSAAGLEGSSLTPVPMPSMSAQQLQYWEDSACEACASIVHLPIETVRHLLKTHWSWVHPTFMFVSRPSFLRDAASGGPHFSPLLLLVICFHSTRFTNHGLKDELLARVRLAIGQQLHAEPSIPTIQALLQLSAREIGKGALSRAWLYSGMAFRMAVDMSIFSKPQSAQDPEKLGVREQLAWSCYMWDKAMSLYLGRAPVLLDLPAFDPPRLDGIAETETWIPHFEVATTQHAYQESPAHTVTAFANLCRLVVIVHDVLMTMYVKRVPEKPLPFVQEIAQRLEGWRSRSNPCLVANTQSQICPPPHILTQNLLYYTTIILLHRPLDKSSACRSICRDAAQAVEHLLLLYEKAFGFSHTTYMMAYCSYVAATTAVLDLRDGLDGAQAKLNTYLRALYGARTSCPAIQRSIDIIVKSYEVKPGANTSSELRREEDHLMLAQPEPLPAFPYDDGFGYGYLDAGGDWAMPLGGLDPFASEWSRIPMDSLDGFPLLGATPDMLP